MLLEHRQERRALFGLAVRIDERLFHEFLETGLREAPRRDAFSRPGCVAWHAEMIAGVETDLRRDEMSAELLGPPLRGQLCDQRLWMGGNAQQNIFQVVERGHASERAALHERIE